MPKLLVFAACDKVLIDANTDVPSIISLIQRVAIPVLEGKSIPSNAIATMRWDMLSAWKGESDDTGIKFEQRTSIILPDGQEILHPSTSFELGRYGIPTKDDRAYNIVTAKGFPIGQAGECKIVLSYRKAETEAPWEVAAEYPVTVIHQESMTLPAKLETVET